MTITEKHDVQSTLAAYMREAVHALGHMDYEMRGDRIVAHSEDGTVLINLDYEGERKLGSLNLPMTGVEISCIGFEEEKAREFLDHYNAEMLRAGGG